MRQFCCALLVLAFTLSLTPQTARAGMVGNLETARARQADLAVVQSLLERKQVEGNLALVGLTLDEAKGRIAQMTDADLHAMAGQLSEISATAAGAGNDYGTMLVIGGVALLLVAGVIVLALAI